MYYSVQVDNNGGLKHKLGSKHQDKDSTDHNVVT